MFISVAGVVCIALMLIKMVRLPANHIIFADREVSDSVSLTHRLWPTLAWFAFLLILTSLVGFILALLAFLFTFMRFRAGLGWAFTGVYTAAGGRVHVTDGRNIEPGFSAGIASRVC